MILLPLRRLVGRFGPKPRGFWTEDGPKKVKARSEIPGLQFPPPNQLANVEQALVRGGTTLLSVFVDDSPSDIAVSAFDLMSTSDSSPIFHAVALLIPSAPTSDLTRVPPTEKNLSVPSSIFCQVDSAPFGIRARTVIRFELSSGMTATARPTARLECISLRFPAQLLKAFLLPAYDRISPCESTDSLIATPSTSRRSPSTFVSGNSFWKENASGPRELHESGS